MKKRIITILTALMLFASTAIAGDVCLEWDASTAADLEGYRVFARMEANPYNYGVPAWDGPETTCQLELEDGKTWYFVLRVYDNEDLESVDSNEVSAYLEYPWVNTPPGAVNLRIRACGTP